MQATCVPGKLQLSKSCGHKFSSNKGTTHINKTFLSRITVKGGYVLICWKYYERGFAEKAHHVFPIRAIIHPSLAQHWFLFGFACFSFETGSHYAAPAGRYLAV